MPQSTQTTKGTLYVPGAYGDYTVAPGDSAVASNGIIMFVGEADGGASYAQETDISENKFGPDQFDLVVAKYKSGPIVDAFRGAINASKDDEIAGSFTSIIIAKTNTSGKASSVITDSASATYGTISDGNYGLLGNMLYFAVTANTNEVVPTTGAFNLFPPIASCNISIRLDGAAAVPLTLTAAELPPAMVTTINAGLTGFATGGVDRILLTVSGTLAITVISGNQVQLDRSVAWTNQPSVGDLVYITTGSVIQGAGNANRGSYIITSLPTSSRIMATKLLDAGGSPGTLTPPVNVTAQAISATTDLNAFSPMVLAETSVNPSNGIGRSIEIAELTTGTDLLSNLCYDPTALTKVTWVSKTGAPKNLVSASEYSAKLSVNRQSDGVQESYVAGGEVALKIGYKGTTATLTITSTNFNITGNSTDALTLLLASYPTINDLAVYINSHSSGLYTCSVGTSLLGNLPPAALDEVTATIGTTFGVANGRIKIDAYRFYQKVSASGTITFTGTGLSIPGAAPSGLPKAQPASGFTYLTGGTKGATTNAQFETAIDSLAKTQGNFLVTLISRDATSDIIDALTDSGSTYLIDTINTYALNHCITYSAFKMRRPRQAFLSKRGAFTADQLASANLNHQRVSMAFMDVKDAVTNGIYQFQPWMGAVKAAAMQAAGNYRSIFNKSVNCSGALQAAGDYDSIGTTDQETALIAGLLPMKSISGKGVVFSSDQTTYTKDSNFVYNSIQAVYAADVILMTSLQGMEAAFLGESLADVDATLASTKMQEIIATLLRLKWLAKSDDAPRGFKNLKIQLNGGVMKVQFEAKLSGSIYFVLVSFFITQVQSSSSA